MFWYIFRRIIYIIPTLIAVILLTFFLLESVPSDRVLTRLQFLGIIASEDQKVSNLEQIYLEQAKELNLNHPQFYFSIYPSYYPTNLYERYPYPYTNMAKLILQKNQEANITDSIILQAKEHYGSINFAHKAVDKYVNEFLSVKNEGTATNKKFYNPKFVWHGAQNRFHLWIKDIISNNFGTSLQDGKPVGEKIKEAFFWTFTIATLSLLFMILMTLLFGTIAAYYHNRFIDRLIVNTCYLIYAIPLFWLATMLVMFFTHDEYGMHIFPSVGITLIYGEHAPWYKLWQNMDKILLPSLCLAVYPAAYLVKILRASILTELQKSYFETALLKGIKSRNVFLNHIVPNSLIATITLITGIIPNLLSGSLVIEVIFNIPGLGRLMYYAILQEDWNIMLAVVVMGALIIMVSFLVGDTLQKWLNPQANIS